MIYDKTTPPNPRAKKPVICRVYPTDIKTKKAEPNPQVIQWFRLHCTPFNRSVILN